MMFVVVVEEGRPSGRGLESFFAAAEAFHQTATTSTTHPSLLSDSLQRAIHHRFPILLPCRSADRSLSFQIPDRSEPRRVFETKAEKHSTALPRPQPVQTISYSHGFLHISRGKLATRTAVALRMSNSQPTRFRYHPRLQSAAVGPAGVTELDGRRLAWKSA